MRQFLGMVIKTTESNRPRMAKAGKLAPRFGISRRTLFRWADAGFITRHKIGERIVLFDEEEVVAFIEGSRTAGGVR